MTWAEVIESPYLKDLPFKIELNEWGQIVMSPAANNHGFYQSEIHFIVKQQMNEGAAFTECSVQTSKNTKVPDVVWMSAKFLASCTDDKGFETPLEHAPELCVEVLSPSNTVAELQEKRDLYFERGAIEVWFCSEDGEMSFFDRNGEIRQSVLFPIFPKKIKTPF